MLYFIFMITFNIPFDCNLFSTHHNKSSFSASLSDSLFEPLHLIYLQITTVSGQKKERLSKDRRFH